MAKNIVFNPIVVKDNRGTYELIDGQQRLTTLYLIMKYLSLYIDLHYNIEYATRKSENGNIGSKELLENIDTIDLNAPASNIDELFIKNAYTIIKTWFDGEKSRMNSFARKLQNYVTIIWYEVDSDEDSIGIFYAVEHRKNQPYQCRIGQGLISQQRQERQSRSLCRNPYGIDNKKQYEIALQWDSMEKSLHNSKFWSFITNEKEDRYPIHMELFFDIMENKPVTNAVFIHSTDFMISSKKSTNRIETWETIVRYYQQLWEW